MSMKSRGVATPEEAAKLGIPGTTWVIWHPKQPLAPQTEKPVEPKVEQRPEDAKGEGKCYITDY